VIIDGRRNSLSIMRGGGDSGPRATDVVKHTK
jgi:hypothetical protein